MTAAVPLPAGDATARCIEHLRTLLTSVALADHVPPETLQRMGADLLLCEHQRAKAEAALEAEWTAEDDDYEEAMARGDNAALARALDALR